MKIHSEYLGRIYEPLLLQQTVNETMALIQWIRRVHPFEAIAFTGYSGAGIAFPISMQLQIPLICVRKDKDDSHHSSFAGPLEGATRVSSFIILDDFIGSGITINRILTRLKEGGVPGRCEAIALWDSKHKRIFKPNTSLAYDYAEGIPVYDSCYIPGEK